MKYIILKKLKPTDKKYFAKWWRDKDLLKLTSGILKRISDQEVDKYFSAILHSKNDYHFMIIVNNKAIGHISLVKSRNNWYETQIVIGDQKYWNKGIGSKTVQLLIKKAHRLGITKIYLEVRPTNIRAIKAYEKCGFGKTQIKHYPKNKFLSKTIRMELKG
jgi:aminoglycoside 6'-N-acetyltransferase